jgi:Cys-tRNA synthase (O-phospho-L-seryl-tRNA:Cys-tRNA synthase)
MPRATRRPLAQTDILEIWDFIADDGIDVVRVLHGARDQKKESMFAIGDHAVAPRGESLEQASVAHPSGGGHKAHASRSDLRDRLRRAG